MKGNYAIFTIATVVIMIMVHVDCHPQCLDFRAPFTPLANLTFCSEYSEIGCCGSTEDQLLEKEYQSIQSRTSGSDWEKCQGFVKEILCQKCSPYAAHIYDAEGTSEARTFPGLCNNYCRDFFGQCRRLIRLLDRGLAARTFLATRGRFCRIVALSDEDYCYPDLKTNPVLLRNLSSTAAGSAEASSDCLCLEELKDNLENPLWARHAGDGTGRLFVAQQNGRVRIFNTQTKKWSSSCFLDFGDKAVVSRSAGDERGFLGMAFHPNYKSNGRFFVYYSTSKKEDDVLPPELEDRNFGFRSKVVISELKVSDGNPNEADPNSEKVLLEVFQPFSNHNGGEMLFGIDGYLYAFIGDGGGGGDPMDAGQDKSLLHGKVIRIDVDSDPSQPYTIPPDNPFVDDPNAKPEIYAFGIRNIWRCGLDRGDRTTGESRGRILCGDVGQNKYEEIDVLKKGANYGWNGREGFECYDNSLCGNIGPEELPIHAYDHSIGKSVTGGVFYRGCENPALNGQYIYGDYVTSRLFSLTESGGSWTNKDVNLCGSMCQGDLVGSLNDYILSFGEDEEGEIYILTSRSSSSSQNNGKLFKIIDPNTRNDPSSCDSNPTWNARVALSARKSPFEAGEATKPSPMKIAIRVRTWRRQERNRSRKRSERRFRRRQRKVNSSSSSSIQSQPSSSQRQGYDAISGGERNMVRKGEGRKSERLSRRRNRRLSRKQNRSSSRRLQRRRRRRFNRKRGNRPNRENLRADSRQSNSLKQQ